MDLYRIKISTNRGYEWFSVEATSLRLAEMQGHLLASSNWRKGWVFLEAVKHVKRSA